MLVASDGFFVGVKDDESFVSVDDHEVAAGNFVQERPGAEDGRNFESAGDDGGVASGAARFGDEAANVLAD